MRKTIAILLLLGLYMSLSSISIRRLDFRNGMFKNVCKDLKEDVLLYFVFVDTRQTLPWTEFDIRTTIDSVRIAVAWLQNQAKENGIPLRIKTDYYVGNDAATVRRNLPGESLEAAATKPNLASGRESLNRWADFIARKVGESLYFVEKDGIPEISKPRTKERLIAHLRDEYKAESVALMFFLNNYYKTDISIPVNHLSTDDVEFAVVSYKYPAEIVHNFLHLFGAADLHESPFRTRDRSIRFAEDEWPNEIMHDPYAKNIQEMVISDFTQYLIGWKPELADTYEFLLYDRRVGF
jgi:hypothetical protein